MNVAFSDHVFASQSIYLNVVVDAQVEGIIDRELQIARQLIAQKKRDRALLFLKRKKIQEQQMERLDAWLINVEQLVCPHTYDAAGI